MLTSIKDLIKTRNFQVTLPYIPNFSWIR